ncbi:uncharacterized protein LOC119384784 [Rhipicephalus sanguineus]|uniref:uncharacterized protein LOC119384784 n=1 Tax=Rhipicephalus sanguineus TaxID=34632 RepID=UPI0020C2139A|nr:uncharacterized protein LOC119384784 [Rhipicephalus sanguineus]
MDDAEDSADASEASPSTAVTEAEAANSVHPRARKRKRYLEPGQLCVVPRTTLRYQDINLKQCASGTNTVSDLLRTSSNKCCDPQHGSHIAASTSRDETENDTAVCNSSGDSQSETALFGSESENSSDSRIRHDPSSDAHAFETSGECNDDADAESAQQGDAEEFCNMFSDERLPNVDLTVRDAMLILMAYSASVGLNWVHMEKLVSVINLFLGKSVLPTSQYLIRKVWKKWKEDMLTDHFYCEHCGKIVPNEEGAKEYSCPSCNANSSSNVFTTVSIKKQIEVHLSDPKVANALLNSLKKVQADSASQSSNVPLRDVSDGRLYKHLRKDASWWDLSLTFNTDGARVFKSSKCTLWPIQAVINELPVAVRWSHVLLCGLYFGKGHPKMQPFLQVFADAINEPVTVNWECDGQVFKSRIRAVCCCVDAPARAAVLNMKQFNGYYGCSYCHHKGALVGRTVKYPVSGALPTARTDSTVRKDMQLAASTGGLSRGFKGHSPLARLHNFDLVWSVSPDYMHCVLEGVCKQLAEAWFGAPRSAAYIGEPSTVRQVNFRLLGMTPPQWVTRLPRAIEERALWKASEWKWWLLFYAVPCLDGILPDTYHEHLSLLVSSVYLLLKDAVVKEDVCKAMDGISSFVIRAQELYSEAAMTFNVHQLLHLPNSVLELGPLWSHSTFIFESGNGFLLRLISDANGVPKQVLERFVMKAQIAKLANTLQLSECAKVLCKELMPPPAAADDNMGPRLLGKGIVLETLQQDEQMAYTRASRESRCWLNTPEFSSEGVQRHGEQRQPLARPTPVISPLNNGLPWSTQSHPGP